MRRFTRLTRLAGCGRWLNGSAEGVVVVRIREGVAHYSGLQTCASVWSCPACSAKIRQARAAELETGVANWLARGGGVEFVTLTAPHRLDDDLAPLFDRIAEGWRRGVVSGRWFSGVRRTFGIRGYCRTIEVTLGASGWHPHVHALLFTDKPLSGRKRAALSSLMFAQWARWVARAGGGVCSRAAFRIVPAERGGVGQYLVKLQDAAGDARRLGMEFTRGDLKVGRSRSCTPFELIAPAANGEAWALRRWWEWERVTKGRRCLTWSRGCRELLGLNAEETSDAEEAQREVGGEVARELGPDVWRVIVSAPGADGALLCACEVGAGAADVLLANLRAGP